MGAGTNVLAVSIPAGTNVVFDASMVPTALKSLSSASPVTIAGSSLQISDGFAAAGLTQTGGELSGKGNFNVTGAFNQSAGKIDWGNTLAVVTPSGNIVFSNLTAPAVNLTASTGSITGNGAVVTDALTTNSATGAVMNSSDNRLKTFLATNTGSGNIELTNTGATALDLCSVADGRVDGTIDCADSALGPWDYLGAMLVLSEAGASIADAHGRDLLVIDHAARRTPVSAATPELFEVLLAARQRQPAW